MKLLFVAQNLQIGGVQKSLINLLKELKSNEKILLDLFVFGNGPLLEEVPNFINIYQGTLLLQLVSTPFSIIKKGGSKKNLLIRILLMVLVRLIGYEKLYRFLFKRQIKLGEYDVAVSYFNDVPNGYFNRGTNQYVLEYVKASKKYAWIHTDPIEAKFNYNECIKTYKKFDKIICVSKACKERFDTFIPEYKTKTAVIYNLFPINEIKNKSKEYVPFDNNNIINIVSLGRIDNVSKRFNLIPYICKSLKDMGVKDFYWRVIGSGLDLIKNKRLIVELGVEDLVEFIGEKQNPYPFIANSQLFVLTSAYEGYPMVIGESLILETPIVSTCYSAANEQIVEGINGIITNFDIEDIIDKLHTLLKDKRIIDKFKANIINNPYSNHIAINQFIEEFNIEKNRSN